MCQVHKRTLKPWNEIKKINFKKVVDKKNLSSKLKKADEKDWTAKLAKTPR